MPNYRRDHTAGATYFFTLAIADRDSDLLVRHIDHLRRAYALTRARHPFDTVAIVVLPDHLHAIWTLPERDHDFGLRWSCLKRFFSASLSPSSPPSGSKCRKREKGIWQRRFWEHRIRDDADLAAHVDYIHFNPVKHGLVRVVRDWPHSSFHAFVRRGELPADWGGVSSQGIAAGER